MKGNILTLGGVGAMGLVFFLFSFSPMGVFLGFAACIFVMFFDYWIYYSKRIVEKSAEKKIICPHCHAVVRVRLGDCSNCENPIHDTLEPVYGQQEYIDMPSSSSTSLSSPSSTSLSSPSSTSLSSPSRKKGKYLYCPPCNKYILSKESNDRFCPLCGRWMEFRKNITS